MGRETPLKAQDQELVIPDPKWVLMRLSWLVWDAIKIYIHSLPQHHPPHKKKKKLLLKSNGFNDLENLDAGNSKGDHIKLDQYKQAKLDLSSCGHRFYLLNQVFRLVSLFNE